MPAIKPFEEAASIVITGAFNPAILQPHWLAANGLIKAEEAENAEIKVISPEVTSFSVDWLALLCTGNKFQASSRDPAFHQIVRDLVIGIFTLLEFTPTRNLGMNRSLHLGVDDETKWHELGDRWAPKGPWKDVLSGNREGGEPGLISLTMEGRREGSEAKYVRVRVEPSGITNPGIFLSTNEHYELAEEQPPAHFIEILGSSWDDAQAFALKVADHLLADFVGKGNE